ncbi:MAG: winged helix-turn-helix domain-containing protein [Xanthomonadales bacterium]
MHPDAVPLRFGAYCLHPTRGLSHEGRWLRVTPKTLKLLWELARRPREVVTKEQLFAAVWPGAVVTDAALSSCVAELRRVLDDDARDPRFLQTVHRVGFRFLPQCAPATADYGEPDSPGQTGAPPGCETAYARLLEIRNDSAITGPHVVLLQGGASADLAKSLLVDSEASSSWQCAAGEAGKYPVPGCAYQPLLQSILGLCLQQPEGVRNIADLRRLAPAWLAELPELLGADELSALRKRTTGSTTARLHAELTAFFLSVCERQPVLLVLDRLADADAYTLDALAELAGVSALPLLVAGIVESSADGATVEDRLRDAGAGAGAITRLQVPPSEAVEQVTTPPGDPGQGKQPAEDCTELLAFFSCAGVPCTADLVAAILDTTVTEVESRLEQLVSSGHLLRNVPRPELRTGNASNHYRLRDATSLADTGISLEPARRTILHRRLARHLETLVDLSGAHALAPRIAAHYGRAHDPARALHWRLQAAAINARRGAHGLSLAHLERGRVELDALTADEREEQAAALSLASARAYTALEGFGCPSAKREYRNVHRIQRGLRSPRLRFACLWELWVNSLNSAPLDQSAEIVSELEALAEQLDAPDLALHAHHARWGIAFMQGDLASVLQATRRGMSLCGDATCDGMAMTRGCTPMDAHDSNHQTAVCAGFFRAWTAGLMGRREDARAELDAAISHARDVGHPYSLAVTLTMAAAAMCAAGDAIHARRYAEEGQFLARDHGFRVVEAWSAVYRGWAEARLGNTTEGLATMRRGLSLCENTDLWLFRPFQLSLLAGELLACGDVEEAAYNVQEALEVAERVGDRVAWAELHRLRGEIAMATARTREESQQAERDLLTALDFATGQKADLLVDRAHASLERLRRHPGTVTGWFTTGRSTA